jgi:hypothetical protein
MVRSAPLYQTGRISKMIENAISLRLRRVAWSLFVLAGLSASGAVAAQAQQFSADIVTRRDHVLTRAGRLNVLDGKVRIETAEHPDGFFLVDTVKPSAYFVRPGARIYMNARQSSRLTQLFVPLDPDAPCRQWQAMARVAGMAEQGEWRCERIGEETIDGHGTVAFRALSPSGAEVTGWIERRFPLQIKTDDGTLITLERIKDEPQPVSSFEFPATFGKFSPEALIDRIKQSDVWVAKPDDAQPSRPE